MHLKRGQVVYRLADSTGASHVRAIYIPLSQIKEAKQSPPIHSQGGELYQESINPTLPQPRLLRDSPPPFQAQPPIRAPVQRAGVSPHTSPRITRETPSPGAAHSLPLTRARPPVPRTLFRSDCAAGLRDDFDFPTLPHGLRPLQANSPPPSDLPVTLEPWPHST